jgi:hypothetical protein
MLLDALRAKWLHWLLLLLLMLVGSISISVVVRADVVAPNGFTTKAVFTKLSEPVEVKFFPDGSGRALVLLKTGHLWAFQSVDDTVGQQLLDMNLQVSIMTPPVQHPCDIFRL